MIHKIEMQTPGQGLHEITERVQEIVRDSDLSEGLCSLIIQHTSASLTIQENADPSARKDLEAWLCRLVPENDPNFTHVLEGPDDMPSHIKSALTSVTLSIPVVNGSLALGTWQGIYVWEHRALPHKRRIVVHIA